MDLPSVVVGGSTTLVGFAFGLLAGSFLTRRQISRRETRTMSGVPRADFEDELLAAMGRASSGEEPGFTQALGRQSVRRFVHLARSPHDSGRK
jgi:hypothetical protein